MSYFLTAASRCRTSRTSFAFRQDEISIPNQFGQKPGFVGMSLEIVGLCGGLRLDRANNQLGVGRTRDEIERHAIALAVAVGPRGTDFEPGAFLAAFLLDDRVNAMRRAVAPMGDANRVRPQPLSARAFEPLPFLRRHTSNNVLMSISSVACSRHYCQLAAHYCNFGSNLDNAINVFGARPLPCRFDDVFALFKNLVVIHVFRRAGPSDPAGLAWATRSNLKCSRT